MNGNRHRTLIILFCVFLLASFFYFNHTPRICVIAEIEFKREFILTVSPLSVRELELAKMSLRLIREIDPNQHYDAIENVDVHWMDSKKFVGMTVYRSDGSVIILLDRSIKIKNESNPWEYVKLGAIYSHELSHALHGTKDPHTEEITDIKVWTLLRSDNELTKWVSDWKP